MRVTDLMVGDFIYAHEPECKGHRIDYISEIDEEVGADGELYSINDIRPIPLTEEILVKNGFALDKTLAVIGTKVYTRPCPAGDLSVKVFHDGSIRFGFIKLNYVHQLQHLLRLCGIEKEMEL